MLADGVRLTGCTVHFVRPDMDAGPIIVQAAVAVHDGDDEDALAARVLAAEHRCFPLAVRLIAEGRVRIAGERVSVKGVWDVQFEVAGEIIKSLKLALTAPLRADEEIPTGSFEAYDSYLKARELTRSWDLDQNRKAIDELRNAR